MRKSILLLKIPILQILSQQNWERMYYNKQSGGSVTHPNCIVSASSKTLPESLTNL